MSDVSGFLGTRRGSRKAQGGTPNAALAGGGGSPAVWIQTDHTANTLPNGTTMTWSGANFGAANANRVMVLVWASSGPNATGVTIGGVTATEAVAEGSEIAGLQIWYASVASGTSGNVVATSSGTMQNALTVLGQVVTTTPTPAHTNSSATNANPASLTITVPSSGVAVVAYENTGNLDTITWSSATKDVDDLTSFRCLSQAHTTTTGSVTPQASSAAGSTTNHMVVASWGP